MKANEDFRTFYQSTLLPNLKELESDREKLISKMKPFLILAILLLVTCILGFAIGNSGNQNPVLLTMGVGSLVCILLLVGIYWLAHRFYFSKRMVDLKIHFKQKIITQMIKSFDEGLHYEPHRGISEQDYHQSQLMLKPINLYTSEDLVSGKLGSTAIRFSEVHAQKEEVVKDEDGDTTDQNTIFKGIFFVADFNKNFSGRTTVVHDSIENRLGSLVTMFEKTTKSRGQQVKMDNTEFEKEFAVYSSDPVEAHYILSPSLMKRIMDFRKKSGKISLSFVDSSVFIAIPVRVGLNLFEPKIYSSLIDYNRMEEYNRYLVLLTGIVDDLNLNNRIWTKA